MHDSCFPYLTDSLEAMVQVAQEAKKCGAKFFLAGELTLPGETKHRFLKVLQSRFPSLTVKYERLYGPSGYAWKSYSEKVRRVFLKACEMVGIKGQVDTGLPETG